MSRWKVRPYDDGEPFVAITDEEELNEVGYVWLASQDRAGVKALVRQTKKLFAPKSDADMLRDLHAIVCRHNADGEQIDPASPRPWRLAFYPRGGWKEEAALSILDANEREVLAIMPDERGFAWAKEIVALVNREGA